MWSFYIFLWCYVTLAGLLALFSICLMHFYQRVPPYYIVWNSSVLRLPHPDLPPPL